MQPQPLRLERLAAERGPLAMLIRLRDFTGWSPAALWADLRFDLTHQEDMARIAIVGESTLERWVTEVSNLFLSAEVQYFDLAGIVTARRWLTREH